MKEAELPTLRERDMYNRIETLASDLSAARSHIERIEARRNSDRNEFLALKDDVNALVKRMDNHARWHADTTSGMNPHEQLRAVGVHIDDTYRIESYNIESGRFPEPVHDPTSDTVRYKVGAPRPTTVTLKAVKEI